MDETIFALRLKAIHDGMRGLEEFCDAEESVTHKIGYQAVSYGLFELAYHLQDLIDDLNRCPEQTETTKDEGGAQ